MESTLADAVEHHGCPLKCRVRKQTEAERRKSVVRIFIGMFAGCIRRHQIWNVVPWDPGAW